MAVSEKEKQYLESIKNQESTTEETTGIVNERLGKSDRECILVFNEEEGVWYADSSIPKFWRRLEAKNWECINTQYYKDGTVCSKTFRGSKKGVTITDPFRKREMSDEQREAARRRMSEFKQGTKTDS